MPTGQQPKAAAAAPPQAPDLSHIAEQLRPLAAPCSDLTPDPANARRHPEPNLAALKGSLRAYGQRRPIVVNRRTGTIEAGNGTLRAALALGWSHLAVVYVDDDPVTAAGFSIADNRTAELAEWDREALDRLLGGIRTDDPLLEQMLAELGGPGGRARRRTDPDDVPAPPGGARTRPGNLWRLRGHRLLCGDPGKPADVDRLLGGAAVHLVHTAPPHGVRAEPRSGNAVPAGPGRSRGAGPTDQGPRGTDGPPANDHVPGGFTRPPGAWFGNLGRVLLPGRAFYVWGGHGNLGDYPAALAAAGLRFAQAIVWDRRHAVPTGKDYLGAHEWCFYGWREGAAHQFFGPADATDLWSVREANPRGVARPTERPVELAARALAYSSRPGENVLDLFGGGGSTLIAAEQLGRKAFLVEPDAPSCDVIVARWEAFTGRGAERAAAG
jgi:hypothetical protein